MRLSYDTGSLMALIEAANGKRLTAKARANARSVCLALSEFGGQVGLHQPHRLAQYLAQLAHESAGFRHDREIWGPTAAQRRYEGRKDLGNTRKGDGRRFAGHGPIQVTGRSNHRQFTQWCRKSFGGRETPDFEATPQAINTDPWEGLTGIWYWDSRNLNRFADSGDVEMITKRINGGLNGYNDRINWLVRFSLVLMGHAPHDIEGAQRAYGVEKVDGIAGPRTRAALHTALTLLTPAMAASVQSAPVTEDRPVVPAEVDDQVNRETGRWGWLMTIGGSVGSGLAALRDADWTTIAAIGGVGLAGLAVLTIMAPRLAKAIRHVREAVEDRP